MKPLLIFQLPKDIDESKKHDLVRTIKEGVEKGCLVVDSEVTILSFDSDGNMDYCTRDEYVAVAMAQSK